MTQIDVDIETNHIPFSNDISIAGAALPLMILSRHQSTHLGKSKV